MTNTPTDDQPGFEAEKPEHCFTGYCLIRAGQTYYLTIEHEVLCADCALIEGRHPRARGPGRRAG